MYVCVCVYIYENILMISRTTLTIFTKFGVYYTHFEHEKTIYIGLNLVKKICLTVCLSVCEQNSRKSRERSNDFQQIWYYMYFGYEKMIYIGLNLVKHWVACLSVNKTLVNLENHSNDFHKIWY